MNRVLVIAMLVPVAFLAVAGPAVAAANPAEPDNPEPQTRVGSRAMTPEPPPNQQGSPPRASPMPPATTPEAPAPVP